MAIIKRYTQHEIREQFTHYGLMFGLVPVYVDMRTDPEPLVCVRNYWPEFLLPLADSVFGLAVITLQAIDPDYEPQFFFKLTKPIRGAA